MSQEASPKDSLASKSVSKAFLIAVIVICVVLILGAVFYLGALRQVPSIPQLTPQANKDQTPPPSEGEPLPQVPVLPDVTPPPQFTNPVEKLPDTNPFEVKTNPFKDSYQNPFK